MTHSCESHPAQFLDLLHLTQLFSEGPLVTLVHGTWGRGVFPALRITRSAFWFEPGGSFRDNLLSELQSRGVACSFEAFLWSGANSIRHRDQAALRLSKQLSDNFLNSPEARQIVLAHSHGGNVVARAFRYLDFDASTLRVCYLATPFLQLFRRTIGDSERILTRAAVMLPCWIAAFTLVELWLAEYVLAAITLIYPRLGNLLKGDTANWPFWLLIMPLALAGPELLFYWMFSEASKVRNADLVEATRTVKNDQSHSGALILRAIDDEASLALSFGTLANFLSARMLSISTLAMLALVAVQDKRFRLLVFDIGKRGYDDIWFQMVLFVAPILVVTSLLVLFTRGVFGRELIYYPPGLQMNVQSVPDFIRSAEIRTLLREDSSSFPALRHGIYNHPEASVVVADWICAVRMNTLRRPPDASVRVADCLPELPDQTAAPYCPPKVPWAF